MWKEAVVAQFEVVSQHWSGGSEESHENVSHDNRTSERHLNPGISRTQPQYSAS
jgi:hypothetical protein